MSAMCQMSPVLLAAGSSVMRSVMRPCCRSASVNRHSVTDVAAEENSAKLTAP